MNPPVPGEREVLDRLRLLVKEVTGVSAESVRLDQALVGDLGAESIDLLDLSFLIEEEFGIVLEANELENEARALLGPTSTNTRTPSLYILSTSLWNSTGEETCCSSRPIILSLTFFPFLG